MLVRCCLGPYLQDTEQKLNIIGLHVYMDDFFGWEYATNLVFFHGLWRPKRQV